MRPPFRVVIVVAACLAACSDLGDPYVYRADCDRSTGSVEFGNVPLGHFSERAVLIANSGNTNLDGEVTLSDSSQFAVVSGGGKFSIPPDGNIKVVLRYAPQDTGFDVAVADLGTGCPPVGLVGTALPPPEGPQCVVDPPRLNFGSIKINETAQETFQVRNVGLIDFDADVQLIDDAGPFEITSGAGFAALDPGDTLRVTVKFAPTVAANYATRLHIGSTCDTLAVNATASPPFTVSFATQIQPIFNSRCTSCHGQLADGALDLRPGLSYGNLVNVLSLAYDAIRVIPGDPDGSVLYGKITGNPVFGSRMPNTGAALSGVQKQLIRTWILEGANND
jgi:hypothetical protein